MFMEGTHGHGGKHAFRGYTCACMKYHSQTSPQVLVQYDYNIIVNIINNP